MKRLLRALVTIDLCREVGDDRFELTASGEMLRDDHPRSLRAWALQVGGPQTECLVELGETVRSGRSWRQRHEGRDGFESLAERPGQAEQFHRAMNELTRAVPEDMLSVVDLRAARHVVDVGGGSGALVAAVLAHCPEAHGVLFDQPHAIAHAPALLRRAGVQSRCECVAGSFFDGVPEGADVYLLKSVLHNWDDERCKTILRRCREAMRPDARVLVVERVVPQSLGTGPADRDVARSDLTMLAALTGRERTRVEFDRLFASAGLRLIRATATAGTTAVIEARRA